MKLSRLRTALGLGRQDLTDAHMGDEHVGDDQLTLLYFDEDAGRHRAHLEHCPRCALRYRDLESFLNTLRDTPVPQPEPAWEQALWSRLAPGVANALAPRRSRSQRLVLRPWVLVPALAASLTAAFFLGRFAKPASPDGVIPLRARDRVLLITLSDHLDRSRTVLAQLVNEPEGKALNIAPEQQLAEALVDENRLLRQIVARRGDRSDTAVLDELERVLIEIAHAPSAESPGELAALQQRTGAQELLFKVRVIGSKVREKGMKL